MSASPATPAARALEASLAANKGLTWLVVVVVLAAVSSLYFSPTFMLQLSDVVWSCFG